MSLFQVLLKVCRIPIVGVLLLALVCGIRTFVLLSSQDRRLSPCSAVEGDDFIPLTTKRWEAFKKSLTFKTISHDCGHIEETEMKKFVSFIFHEYPAVFKSKLVTYEMVANYSILIHVQGKNKSLMPYMVAGHLDVVPVHEDQWSVNPFNATEDADGTKVYGRGALDDKGSVMAQLSALETFLKIGRVPERSFYLAYGHDEETMGEYGARNIARALRKKGVDQLHFILDEGMLVLKDMIPGVSQKVIAIGVSEKGIFNLNISVEYTGGHSSMPSKESAVSIIGDAVHRLHSQQMLGIVDELTEELLLRVAPFVRFPFNVIACNLWLFRPVVAWALSSHKTLQGTVRTTTAPTILGAGSKYNVIPSTAWAVINHRIHPRDTKEDVIAHVRRTINDERVKISEGPGAYFKPHPISPFDRESSLPYQVLADTAEQLFEDSITVPALMVASTDTKHYLAFSKNVYRFNPIIAEPKDLATIHAEDEVLSKENYQRMINFYYHLFLNSDRAELRSLSRVYEEL